MKYLNITGPDVNNGTGFRITLWVAGCSRHCKGCQNPGTWNYEQGRSINECREELMQRLASPYIKGLTLSGGDPLDQSDESLDELRDMLSVVKKTYPDKDIWIYSGEYFEDAIKNPHKEAVLRLCDTMVDGPYIEKQRDLSLPFRGSKNQRILDLHNDVFWVVFPD